MSDKSTNKYRVSIEVLILQGGVYTWQWRIQEVEARDAESAKQLAAARWVAGGSHVRISGAQVIKL